MKTILTELLSEHNREHNPLGIKTKRNHCNQHFLWVSFIFSTVSSLWHDVCSEQIQWDVIYVVYSYVLELTVGKDYGKIVSHKYRKTDLKDEFSLTSNLNPPNDSYVLFALLKEKCVLAMTISLAKP